MKILYWGHGPCLKNEKIRLHRHDFHQLEIILYGSRRCKSPEDDIVLRDGEAVIIPFNVAHRFYTPSDDLEYLSFKFSCDEEYVMPSRIYKVPNDPFINWIIKDFWELTRNKRYNSSPVYIELIHALFADLLEHLHRGNLLNSEAPLLREIRTAIFRYGARITVSTMAHELGMSVYKFRRKFKKIAASLPTGTISPNPQIFIKNEILALAYKNLQESNVSISEVSDMLHFCNVYTFSRFFKNSTGLSPTEFRRREGSSDK